MKQYQVDYSLNRIKASFVLCHLCPVHEVENQVFYNVI